jgi:hypothetical protein
LENAAYATLDFWLGEWDVWAEGERVGENRIEKILKGCAIVEHWRDARGGRGRASSMLFQTTRSGGRYG